MLLSHKRREREARLQHIIRNCVASTEARLHQMSVRQTDSQEEREARLQSMRDRVAAESTGKATVDE